MYNSESVVIIHEDSYDAKDFIKNSLFYYKKLDHLLITDEFTLKFDTICTILKVVRCL